MFDCDIFKLSFGYLFAVLHCQIPARASVYSVYSFVSSHSKDTHDCALIKEITLSVHIDLSSGLTSIKWFLNYL